MLLILPVFNDPKRLRQQFFAYGNTDKITLMQRKIRVIYKAYTIYGDFSNHFYICITMEQKSTNELSRRFQN